MIYCWLFIENHVGALSILTFLSRFRVRDLLSLILVVMFLLCIFVLLGFVGDFASGAAVEYATSIDILSQRGAYDVCPASCK